MTLRRPIGALVAVLLAPALASAATYTTDNFIVDAPTPELAKRFGDKAEEYREQKALEWTGRKMPRWSHPCPLTVKITPGSAGGATTFNFGTVGGKPVVTDIEMTIRGDAQQLLNSVLPHEVTHTVLANYFGRPVPRWADEGGSVLSENDEERYKHDVTCRELLNAGRGIRCRVLFQMAEYPSDISVLYAEGFSLSRYLVKKGGDGTEGRGKFLQFLAIGMAGNDPRDRGQMKKRFHGSPESWNEAANKVYGFDSVDALEEAWLVALKTTAPVRAGTRDTGGTAGLASTSGTRTELRTSAAPTVPLLEPPVKVVRAAPPDNEPVRRLPDRLPDPDPSPFGPTPAARPMAPDHPPVKLLQAPELPAPNRP